MFQVVLARTPPYVRVQVGAAVAAPGDSRLSWAKVSGELRAELTGPLRESSAGSRARKARAVLMQVRRYRYRSFDILAVQNFAVPVHCGVW